MASEQGFRIMEVDKMSVNQDTIIARLVENGIIIRQATRGWYKVFGEEQLVRRPDILVRFAVETAPGRYLMNDGQVAQVRGRIFAQRNQTASDAAVRNEEGRHILRTINRDGYHQNGSGSNRAGVQEALEQIPFDEDGVRRSFGIEYEVYDLTEEQEDKLARMLDTMPAHHTERDGSLGRRGVEIIFMPVGAAKFIEIVTTLAQFVSENNVTMDADSNGIVMAGMHITYGVSNSEATRSDLQIRLNRFALAVKSIGTVRQIKSLFGRDFGRYRELPQTTTTSAHSNAFSTAGRPSSCWECRLPSWQCDPTRMVQFFKATEVAFHRPVRKEDFVAVFDIIGGNEDEQQ